MTALHDALTESDDRFLYRCADGGYQAVSSELITDCMWHGSDCIDWYLQVDPEKVAPLLAAADGGEGPEAPSDEGSQTP